MTALDERPAVTARTSSEDPNLDLGFGSVVARESRKRLLNRDGTFNVRREGLPFWQSLSGYHYMLTITWTRFLGWVGLGYVISNLVFAVLYVACGENALTAFHGESYERRFLQAFFFSVQTLATIGYGATAPSNLAANLVVTFEALYGLLGLSIIAGIMFARFSRPIAGIIFSNRAVIAPYRDKTAFMFRIVNQKSNELVELRSTVLMARRRKGATDNDREFIPLELERDHVVFFPLTWTIVHPIDQKSPLWGMTPEDLVGCDIEFLVLLNGFDETFSQTVHTRSSYKANEVVWGARFRSMFDRPHEDGTLSVDIRKLHEVEPIDLALRGV